MRPAQNQIVSDALVPRVLSSAPIGAVVGAGESGLVPMEEPVHA